MVEEGADGAQEARLLGDVLGEGGAGWHGAADDDDVDFDGAGSWVSECSVRRCKWDSYAVAMKAPSFQLISGP